MTNYRWHQIFDFNKPLTPEEISEGWHFCQEFDGLLIGPGWGELEHCFCLPGSHPVYTTVPKRPDEPAGAF